ncbi:MAG: hypothetical protein N3A57_07920, partial [Negativicutes bacterium]|nr:hypothetical protein [Negativicutes bacterium]
VLTDCNSVGAERFAERVKSNICQLSEKGGDKTFHPSVVIGVASYSGGPPDEFIQAAVNALAESENMGKNAVCTDWHI